MCSSVHLACVFKSEWECSDYTSFCLYGDSTECLYVTEFWGKWLGVPA